MSPLGRPVYWRGSGPTVIVLHELNGLSPGAFDFAANLAASGFKVHLPLLFGHPCQDSSFLGYLESCLREFACSSVSDTGKAGAYVKKLVGELGSSVPALAVVGMCLTGAFPLETLFPGTKVRAAVMSQPALPFGSGAKQRSVGVSEAQMKAARDSKVPILGLRFKKDTICTCERFKYLQLYFGQQFAKLELDAPDHFHATWTHRLHAVLTGDFGAQKEKGRTCVREFLHKHLD